MIAFRNPLFDGQLRRTIGHGTYGGAELGECLATAGHVIDGDRESWYSAWLSLADRNVSVPCTAKLRRAEEVAQSKSV